MGEKIFENYDKKELGIYVIRKLFEMGFSEEEIEIILRQSLQISIDEKLKELNKRNS